MYKLIIIETTSGEFLADVKNNGYENTVMFLDYNENLEGAIYAIKTGIEKYLDKSLFKVIDTREI